MFSWETAGSHCKIDVRKDKAQVSCGSHPMSPAHILGDSWACCPMGCWEFCCLPSPQGHPRGQSSPTVLSPWPRPPAEPHTTISGQSPGLGSRHKKEWSQAIRGFWIKSNTFEVLTHIPGPREQPVLMRGAVGGRQLTEQAHGCWSKSALSTSAPFHNLWNKGIYF